MKILLTGLLPASVKDIGARLEKEGHQVLILGHGPKPFAVSTPSKAFLFKSSAHTDIKRFMKAARFQVVVFFYAYRCEMEMGAPVQGALLDDLSIIMGSADQGSAEHLVLITDRRVFGNQQAGREDEEPVPESPTGVLIRAAENLMGNVGGRIPALILRVTSLYAEGDPDSFFSRAVYASQHNKPFQLPGSPSTRCDFLHSDDLARFLCQAIDARMTGVVHLAYGGGHNYRMVLANFKKHRLDVNASFTDQAVRHTLEIGRARESEWVPRHDFITEMDKLLSQSALPRREKGPSPIAKRIRQSLYGVLPWVEVAVLGAASWALKRVAETNASLRFVDFGLLYVAVMGASHGSVMGVLSALIAYALYIAEWTKAGNDLYLLLYNTDNWLLPAGYLLVGVIFGSWRDNQRDQVEELSQQKAEQEAKKKRLQTMYAQTREDRDRLLDQVMRYRDNYGRIYRITRELDTMQPEQVFLSACEMVEAAMQNQSAALYARKGRLPYIRLVTHSEAEKRLARSLDLRELPRLRESLDEGRLFVNTGLEPGYPAIAAPIGDEQDPLAAIFLWEVPFDKQTLYYTNLLIEVAGLVQAALVRTIRYSTRSADMDLEDARILTNQAFQTALRVFQDMRKQRRGSFQLARLQGNPVLSPEEYRRRLNRAIRSTDLLGHLEDGSLCAIFPQAEAEDMRKMLKRLESQGIPLKVLPQEASYV